MHPNDKSQLVHALDFTEDQMAITHLLVSSLYLLNRVIWSVSMYVAQ